MFDTPVYKILASNDTGASPGHQGGKQIPNDIEEFPTLTERKSQEILKFLVRKSHQNLSYNRTSDHFFRWFRESKVTDGRGMPLAVYRGEHGAAPKFRNKTTYKTKYQYQSRCGALSFGSVRSALTYAIKPNKCDDFPVAPRVMSCILSIQKPFLNQPNDPYVQMS